jgi:HK97 family phage portal protein
VSWKDWILPPAWQQKASAVSKMVVQMYAGQPVWTPRDYKNLAKEGFSQNVWVYRCVMTLAQAIAAVDWNLYGDRSKKREIESHGLLDLLYKPNEFMSKQEFFETFAAYLLLSGNSYVECNGPDVGPPLELFALRPDRMQVVADTKNFVGGYTYNVDGMTYKYDPSKVAHIKLFHALNDFYGLSPIEVAARGIDNDNAANAWNNAMLNNSARPSGAMTTESMLTDPQYDRLKDQIDTQYKGSKNVGNPMLLEGGLKWQEMGLSPKDMEFINSKKMSRIEICAAFNVPPEMVGDKEHATYSNYQEARQAFYMEGVLPLLDKIRDKLNSWLVPKYGEKLYLDYDIDSIEALQENSDTKAARTRADYQAGVLMLNEARNAIGYDSVPSGDVYLIPGTVWVMSPDGTLKLGPKQGTSQAGGDNGNTDPNAKSFFFRKNFIMLDNEESKTMYWKAIENNREKFYSFVETKVKKHFEAEKTAILASYEGNGDIGEVEKVIDDNKKELSKLLTATDLKVIEFFGQSIFNQLKNEAELLEIKGPLSGFDVFANFVMKWVSQNVAQKVVQISTTTMNQIKGIVSEGISNGLAIRDIAKQIDGLYLDQIIPNRSTVIARTEVISTSNAGSRFGAIQTGLPLEKEWIETRDDRTRETHTALNGVGGQKRARDEYYDLPSGVKLMHPGDPHGVADGLDGKELSKAVAKEVIQCRCTEGYKVIKKPK